MLRIATSKQSFGLDLSLTLSHPSRPVRPPHLFYPLQQPGPQSGLALWLLMALTFKTPKLQSVSAEGKEIYSKHTVNSMQVVFSTVLFLPLDVSC